MKTLLEKLSTENAELLELESQQYPASIEVLKLKLGKINYFTQLEISDASRLISLKAHREFTMLNIIALFEEL
jgi:hypothetical protein